MPHQVFRASLPYIVGTTAGFAGYEILKQVFVPGLTLWQSHVISIIVVAILSTVFSVWFHALFYAQLARFRALSAHATDLVAILNADGTYRYVSPSHRRLLGFAPEELVGRRSFDYVYPEDRAALQAAFACMVERGEPCVSITYRRRHADGSWRIVEAHAANRLADPAVRGIIVNSRDITELCRRRSRRPASTPSPRRWKQARCRSWSTSCRCRTACGTSRPGWW
jgi:PAS domain S-box-containing protein